jgi:dipeptide/tripeptide permease
MKRKNKLINQKEKKEIFYNIVNSALAGALVLFGSLIGNNFEITIRNIIIAILTGILVAITKFKSYWDEEKEEYCKKTKLFKFI